MGISRIGRRTFLASASLTVISATTRARAQILPPALRAAQQKANPPFKLYDWMAFANQPDLRPWGFEPIWGANDGTFNRSTTPDADNITPGVADPARQLFAARRQALAAVGVKPLEQNAWNRPRSYAKVPQDIVFDLEGDAFKRSLDLPATSEERSRSIAALCRCVDAMRDEARKHSREIRIGSYFPIGPFVGEIHPNDPRVPDLKKTAEKDFQPWLSRLDFTMPDCSIMGTDVEEWKGQVNQQVGECRRWVPGKPVYAELQLCYAHFCKDPNLINTRIPIEQWTESVRWLVALREINGICLFGQDMEVPGLDRSNEKGKENGTRRLDFRHVEAHVRVAAEAAAARKAGRI